MCSYVRFGIAVVIFAAMACTHAQASEPIPCRVWVAVSVADDTLKNRLTSSLYKSLRDLGDVVLATSSDQACYTVSVTGIVTKSVAGQTTGFAYAVSFILNVNDAPTKKYIESVAEKHTGSTIPDDVLAAWVPLIRMPDKAEILLNEYVQVGSLESVENVSSEIIESFDTQVLVPERQLQQSIRDSVSLPSKPPRK